MAELGPPDDPMSYVQVLARYGSRAHLDRAAAAGEAEAKLWRWAPSLAHRALQENAAATSRSISTGA
jgi:hypothetical protein